MSYVKPELIVVAVVLYIIGVGIKKMDVIKDKYIPCILGVLGILLWCHLGNGKYIYWNSTRNAYGSVYINCSGCSCCRIECLRKSAY